MPEKEVALFSKLFLDTVKRYGRAHEVELCGLYNMISLNPFKDLGLAAKLGLKGKLNPIPPLHGNRKLAKRIFEKAKTMPPKKRAHDRTGHAKGSGFGGGA